MALGSTEFEFSTLLEVDPLFSPVLWRIQTLYPGAYAQGNTSLFAPLGPQFKLERKSETGTHIYLSPFGRDPSPIQAPKTREKHVGSEAGAHSDLSLIIDNPYPGQAQEYREY